MSIQNLVHCFLAIWTIPKTKSRVVPYKMQILVVRLAFPQRHLVEVFFATRRLLYENSMHSGFLGPVVRKPVSFITLG
jgi:hypothetical protein